MREKDEGNLNYSVMMPKDSFKRSASTTALARALEELGWQVGVNDRNDLVFEDKKISGSAYKLVSERAFHHGTLLTRKSDLNSLRNYLKLPLDVNIRSLGVQSVPSSVTKLPLDISPQLLSKLSSHLLPTITELHEISTEWLINDHVVNYAKMLKSADWMFGQTPRFTQYVKYPPLSLDINIESKDGVIVSVTTTSKDTMLSDYFKRLERQPFSQITFIHHAYNQDPSSLRDLAGWLYKNGLPGQIDGWQDGRFK